MNLNVENPDRNRPSEEGRMNDPNLRDDSAAQPGISTVSSSDTDYGDEDTTETASDTDDLLDDDDADLDLEDDLEDEEEDV